MSSADDLIISHLRDAQSLEQQSISLLEGHLRSAPPGPYRTAARRHLEETRRHAHGVAERLTNLGATRGPVGTAVTIGEALLGRVHGAAMAPLHLLARRAGPDVVLHNVHDEIAAEAREEATYEALERLAQAMGDTTTASLARTIRADEERYLASLRELVAPLAERVARMTLAQAGAVPARPAAPPEPEPTRPPGAPRGAAGARAHAAPGRDQRRPGHHRARDAVPRPRRAAAPGAPRGPQDARGADSQPGRPPARGRARGRDPSRDRGRRRARRRDPRRGAVGGLRPDEGGRDRRAPPQRRREPARDRPPLRAEQQGAQEHSGRNRLNLDTTLIRLCLVDALTIHEAAETTGWSARMLRYVEQLGLVEPRRSGSGYRLYGPEELQRLRTLRELLESTGIGLAEVGFALRLRRDPQLRGAVEAWFEATPARPVDVPAGDWLSWEQEKHSRLLATLTEAA